MAHVVELHTLLGVVHLVRGCLLLSDKVMLYSNYLVDTIAEAGHLLTALMQTVLRETVLHDRII